MKAFGVGKLQHPLDSLYINSVRVRRGLCWCGRNLRRASDETVESAFRVDEGDVSVRNDDSGLFEVFKNLLNMNTELLLLDPRKNVNFTIF